jgi:ankyrin repeat protein
VNHQDIYGFSPLHLAASHDQLDACRLLIRLGADASLQDADGDSAEGRALLFHHWSVSQMLAGHTSL